VIALHRFVVVSLLALWLSQSAPAQFEQAVWDTITIDTLEDRLTSNAIAVNGYEEFHLTYSKSRPGEGWNIYYRYFDLYDGAGPETIIDSSHPCFHPVIASRFSDNDYDIVILYQSNYDIYSCLSHSPLGPWECNIVDSTLEPEFTPSVAFGSNFYHGAWIIYQNSEYDIVYMRSGVSGPPDIEILYESELGDFGSGAQPVIIATGDNPHIFYRGLNDGFYNIHHSYLSLPDSNWVFEYLETPNVDDYSVSAEFNGLGDIYLAISGNEGWGMPSRVHYLSRDHESGFWSNPQLVTGQYSATSATITRSFGTNYIASCGVSGNIFDGNIYLSADSSGSFETTLLGSFRSCMQPVIANIIGEYGVLIFDAPVGPEESRNIELIYYGPDIITAIDEARPQLPSMLCAVYPNPFNSRASIVLELARASNITLDIFDILGQKLGIIFDGPLPEGTQHFVWDAAGNSSGIYFYRFRADDKIEIGKMLLLK
jgi:hypothetical protein